MTSRDDLRRGTPGRAAHADAGPPRRVLHGRRIGRPMRAGRKRLLAELLPRVRVALPEAPAGPGALDPAALFAGSPVFAGGHAVKLRDIWFEVGFGAGEHLCAQAREHPDVGLIGCEPFLNGVGAALGHVEADRLENVRLHADDARAVLECLPDGALGRVFVLFPDPWPKARHAKRRFVSPANLDLLARVMAAGAELRVASDDKGYIRWALATALAHPAFEWTAERAADWRERPADQPPTRYEEKARAKGIRPVFLTFRRRKKY